MLNATFAQAPDASDPRTWVVPVGQEIGDYRVSRSDEALLELRGNRTRALNMIAYGGALSGVSLVLLLAHVWGARSLFFELVMALVGLGAVWGGLATFTLYQRYEAATRTLRRRQLVIFSFKHGPGTFAHVLVQLIASGKPNERIRLSLKAARSGDEDEIISDAVSGSADAVFLIMAGGQMAGLLDLPIYRKGVPSRGTPALLNAWASLPEIPT